MKKIIKKAFTLIELLVVIAIIGILSGLIVVSMSGVTQKANLAKAQVFSNSLRNSMMLNVVAEFKLDGNSNDTWGTIPAGTINGATAVTTVADCTYGTCYSFNGDDYIDYGDQTSLSFANNIFTFSFWLKKPISGTNAVLGKTNAAGPPYEYAIRSSSNANLNFTAWTSTGSNVYANSATVDDGWNFFVWTADGANSYISKNGIKGTSFPKGAGNSLSDTIAPFWIGRGCDGTACVFHNGSLDEIRIYNITVPTAAINENYYIGLSNLLASGQITKEEYRNRLLGMK